MFIEISVRTLCMSELYCIISKIQKQNCQSSLLPQFHHPPESKPYAVPSSAHKGYYDSIFSFWFMRVSWGHPLSLTDQEACQRLEGVDDTSAVGDGGRAQARDFRGVTI